MLIGGFQNSGYQQWGYSASANGESSLTYNYLYFVNRLCYKLNEVPLTVDTFVAADGVYNDFKEAVNAAILDIHQEEDNEWPFARRTTTFKTTIGQTEYTKHADADNIDWNSFYIKKEELTIASLTQTAGTATATVAAGHQLVTGDRVLIAGATETGYNGNFDITVTSSTTFTYAVPTATVTPATGTPKLTLPYRTKKLTYIDVDTYRDEGKLVRDGDNIQAGEYCEPDCVVRKGDNNFIISGKPDREYTIEYVYFEMPVDLALYNDQPTIPKAYKEVVVEGAVYHGYFFRDNLEQATIIEKKYKDDVNRMRRILIPQSEYMRMTS